jgi:hypothetical protein
MGDSGGGGGLELTTEKPKARGPTLYDSESWGGGGGGIIFTGKKSKAIGPTMIVLFPS